MNDSNDELAEGELPRPGAGVRDPLDAAPPVSVAHDTDVTPGGGVAAATTAPEPSEALTSETTSKRSRWGSFLNTGAIVAALALVFTFVSFTVERRSQDSQDRRDARITLTNIISDLSALPRMYYPLDVEAEGNPVQQLGLTNMRLAENQALITQAERILEEYPDIGTPVDFLAIGSALAASVDVYGAIQAFVVAEDMATEDGHATQALTARRSLGELYFVINDVEAARAAFGDALDWRGLTDDDDVLSPYHDLDTMMFWAMAEARSGNCDEALVHASAVVEDPEFGDFAAETYVAEFSVLQELCG